MAKARDMVDQSGTFDSFEKRLPVVLGHLLSLVRLPGFRLEKGIG